VIANADRPLTVGGVVAAVDRSQSTVSRHLRILADEGFVFTEADGVRTLIRVNDACMVALPEATAAIMARQGALSL
jgi:DNA-binding transcriptional ArsR family regulator